MKSTPLLMNDSMVRATFDGTKTQTRRIVKPQPPKWIDRYAQSASNVHWLPNGPFIKDPSGSLGRGALEVRMNDTPVRCPFGTVGDRLWVRETWSCMEREPTHGCEVRYRADLNGRRSLIWEPWSPSIHMPRWASRLTLEITNIRVERLQDISEEDAKAEGAILWGNSSESATKEWCKWSRRLDLSAGVATARGAFAALWTSLYGAESWEQNPWVWAITFRKALIYDNRPTKRKRMDAQGGAGMP